MPNEQITLFWWLIVGHAVTDYWAQSDALAMLKNRHRNTSPYLPWAYAMTAHALMHGGAVAVLTHSIALGVAETVAHWLIDFGKCENWYGIHADQIAHIACKVLWVGIATQVIR